MLSPLNTSMFPIALPDLQREFSTSAGASTWLLTVFALASAVGHPLAGYLADRLGPRRVLLAGLVVSGLSALVAAWAATFSLLLALRTVQAPERPPHFRPGSRCCECSTPKTTRIGLCHRRGLAPWRWSPIWARPWGPMLGAALLVTVGWRALFLANLPIVMAATLLLRHVPPDRAAHAARSGSATRSRIVLHRQPFSVSARFAVACTVFFAAFFALPVWLLQSSRLGAVETGAAMAPMVIVSALITPMAARTVSRSAPRRDVTGGRGWLVSRNGSAGHDECTDVGGRAYRRDGGPRGCSCLQ